MGYKLGIDVGGTFTDVCLFNEHTSQTLVFKTPSTPEDPSVAISHGIKMILQENEVKAEQITYLVHGTTVATNAAIEKKGAKTAIITTKGFRDLLELARQTRPSVYNLFEDKPELLVRRQYIKEVSERLKYDGSIRTPLDRDNLHEIIEQLKDQNVEAIAVCFLHSYVNPVHEQQVKEMLSKQFPEAYVSISSEVLPEFREYERLSTTTLNSYLGPVVSRYINNFAHKVKELGISVDPYINQSNSGVMSIEMTKNNPIRTALSGPSAGVAGATYLAQLAGFPDIITFDMGGTSTDVCLIQNSTPKVATGKKVAGYPAQVPMTNVHAVGAGGGSIAWVDNGNLLKIGPESAGAKPGPAAYGWGGQEPTVTDANVLLKRLNPEYILGGKMKIHYENAREVIQYKVAEPLQLDLVDAANGIITIVNSNMVRAIRVVSVEQGYDPRDFTLVAFGGAGALHAAEVARELGIRKILVPDNPGLLCALGLLISELKMDYVKTRLLMATEENMQAVKEEFEELLAKAREWLDSEHVDQNLQELELHVDMRYLGQNYELSIPLEYEALQSQALPTLIDSFQAEHEKAYGYINQNEQLQFINYRVTAIGKVSKIQLKEHPASDVNEAKVAERKVYFGQLNRFTTTPIYDRARLAPTNRIEGPAIVEQMDSTIVIPPFARAEIDLYRNIIITLREENE